MKKLLICLLPLLSSCGLRIAAQSKPNIILILADDLGYGDVGYNGQKKFRTPHIDQLAKEGKKFNSFYCGTSVCAPSRSSLMSGLHTGHTYIRGNRGMEPEGQFPIADSVVTIAEVLKSAGYRTGAFGKWGLGPVGSEGDPNRQGFDQFFGYNCQTNAHRYYPEHVWNNNKKVVLEGNKDLLKTAIYAPDLIQNKALEFIDAVNEQQPFFLFLPYILPHAELLVPDDSLFQHYKRKFNDTPYRGADYGAGATRGGYASQEYPHAAFAAMVARLDLYVGQVVEKLRQKGLDKNTLIIFTSDNGPHKEGGADPDFFDSNGPFRGYKRDLYEGGVRVPFVAWWPGRIQAGSHSNHSGAFWDLLPTFAELARTQPHPTDGISFVPTLLGNKKQKKHEYLYWEFHEAGGKQAVKQGNWKAVRLQAGNPSKTTVELYDLTKDIGEQTNVAEQHPEVVKKLAALMDRAHRPSPDFPLFPGEK